MNQHELMTKILSDLKNREATGATHMLWAGWRKRFNDGILSDEKQQAILCLLRYELKSDRQWKKAKK